jgi:putative intracellular protease/amidase
MFGFRENADLQQAIRTFYEAEKPTAALCDGVSRRPIKPVLARQ